MSFNTNDNNAPLITRTNYEEYFLLYVDNELSAEEGKAVENFLALHPDLQAEMEILLTTKLSFPDEISLEDKSFLLADQMKLSTIDESLLLYIDDELDKEEKKVVEKKIVADKEFSLQHQVLLKTKLDPTEQVVYPYKKELYRHTERRIAPYWLRIAAAVIIVLGISAAWMLTNKPEADSSLVNVSPTNNKKAEEIKEQALPAPQTTDVAIAQQETKATKEETEKDIAPVMAKAGENSLERSIAKQASKKKSKEVTSEVKSNNLPVPVIDEPKEPLIAVTEPKIAPQQSLNNNPVTIVSNDPYNNQTSPTTAVTMEDVAKVDKKASLKGLLRKATRFIERRTNISATNENDELLIGAVALKL